MLDRIRIVLVNTSHPGNIGSVARAMKTMGLSDLCLVSPAQFPHDKAYEMASGATDLLHEATVVDTLEQALADCTFVLGASVRHRAIPWPLQNPRDAAEMLMKEPPSSQIAIVFGREQTGLTNDELQQCHRHVQIPANPEYSSLNIAAAVQVIAYELRMAFAYDNARGNEWDYRFANAGEMTLFFNHLQSVLVEIQFLKMNAPRKLMTRLRRLFLRARPDVMEMNILRGILSAVEMRIKDCQASNEGS